MDLQLRPREWERYFVIGLPNNQVALSTCHNTFLRAHPGGEGSKLDLQTFIGPWEHFTLVPLDGGQAWAIQSCHGTYLRAHPGGEGSKIDLQVKIGPWERFQFEKA